MSDSKPNKDGDSEDSEKKNNQDPTESDSSHLLYSLTLDIEDELLEDKSQETHPKHHGKEEKEESKLILGNISTVVVDINEIANAKEVQTDFFLEPEVRRKYTVMGFFSKKLTPEQIAERQAEIQRRRELYRQQQMEREMLMRNQYLEQQRLQEYQQQQLNMQREWQQNQPQPPYQQPPYQQPPYQQPQYQQPPVPQQESHTYPQDPSSGVPGQQLQSHPQNQQYQQYPPIGGSPPPWQQNQQQGHVPWQLWTQVKPPDQPQQTTWTQYGNGQGTYGYEDGGAPLLYDPESRNDFIRKVLIIVLLMIICTAAFVAWIISSEERKTFFMIAGRHLIIPAMIGLIVSNYAMACSPCGRTLPGSAFVLLLTCICMTVFAAVVSAIYHTEIVLYAAIATAAVVFVCLILAFSSFDFTSYMLYVIVISIGLTVVFLIVFIIMLATGVMMKPVMIVILSIATVIQSIMLVIQLQMILGGNNIELGEDDYAMAAYLLYTSIITIFVYMVQILGLSSS